MGRGTAGHKHDRRYSVTGGLGAATDKCCKNGGSDFACRGYRGLVVSPGVPETIIGGFLLIIRLAITSRDALMVILSAGACGAILTQ